MRARERSKSSRRKKKVKAIELGSWFTRRRRRQLSLARVLARGESSASPFRLCVLQSERLPCLRLSLVLLESQARATTIAYEKEVGKTRETFDCNGCVRCSFPFPSLPRVHSSLSLPFHRAQRRHRHLSPCEQEKKAETDSVSGSHRSLKKDKKTAENAADAAPGATPTPSTCPFRVSIKHWRAVASWTWDAGDDVCGICRAAFDGCPPDAKFPGDDAPVVWGACGHAFHLQCISRWLGAPAAEQRCPFCRRAWEYKSAGGGAEKGEGEEGGGGGGRAGGGGATPVGAAATMGRRPPPAVGGGAAAPRTARRARTTVGASPPAVPPVPAP